MSGVLGKCSPTRLLRLLGLNPNDEDDHGPDQFLSLWCPNDREVVLVRSLEARSPVSGAVPGVPLPPLNMHNGASLIPPTSPEKSPAQAPDSGVQSSKQHPM